MNPIFVAIDTADVHHARALVRDFDGHACGLKLGLEFFCANGDEGVLRVAEHQIPLFLDLKFHDIPNTVAGAVRSIAHLNPAVLTVHASGGKDMMKAARDAAPPNTKVVAVTVLTSLNDDDLESMGVRASPARQVERLAAFAREAGLDGIVCSGAEVKAAKADWPEGFFVVPGVRPDGSGTSDQKRIVIPLQALDHGASIIVIGRPITASPNPGRALAEISESLKGMAK